MDSESEVVPAEPVRLLWPSICIAILGVIGGSAAAFMHKEIAAVLFHYVLQPSGSSGPLLLVKPGASVLFTLSLFCVAGLTVTVTVATAWLTSRGPLQTLALFLVLLCCSLLVTTLTFAVYRQYMQETVQVSIGGQALMSRTRGQLTTFSEVPIVELGLLGPLLVSAAAFALRRKSLRGLYGRAA